MPIQLVTEEDVVRMKRLLARDRSGALARAIIESLRESAAALSSAQRDTLSRNDTALSDDMARAVAAAERVVTATWERLHPGRTLAC
ncbi:hypothetical protein HLB44_15710 [Aquincola sp. S2]|uniref:Plasmid stabilization protein n=1 Tax=Pseudaquabacterium terrae TaxID=2732868 RepID=A0ABX2EIN6_9BURK|nr:hypothetical protein [Aquabacterium terrae]NRF68441.1 hypothetical protein [Aquabacterium terrae]